MPETTSDIVRAVNKRGVIVYKAVTERGRQGLGKLLGGPWWMCKEVFMEVPPESEVSVIEALNQDAIDVQVWEPPKPKQVDVSKLTDF